MNDRIPYREPAEEVIHLCRDCAYVQKKGRVDPDEWSCTASPIAKTCNVVSGEPANIYFCRVVREKGDTLCSKFDQAPPEIGGPPSASSSPWWKFWA